jgi:hypothetical protein
MAGTALLLDQEQYGVLIAVHSYLPDKLKVAG